MDKNAKQPTHLSNGKHAMAGFTNSLNEYFKKANFDHTAEVGDFYTPQQFGIVIEKSRDSELSRKLVQKICHPPLHDGEFYHYTKLNNAKKILEEKQLRLTSLEKRIDQGEIKPFLTKFGYEYPQEKNRYKRTLSKLYYTSFTSCDVPKRSEEHLWDNFALKDGARFKFHIKVSTGNFRRIKYGSDIDSDGRFFKGIRNLSASELGYDFFWDDASIACATHLGENLRIEHESRLLYSTKWEKFGMKIENGGDYSYVNLKFGENKELELCIKLLEVQSNSNLAIPSGVRHIPRED